MPAKKRRAWVRTWNATYKRCTGSGGTKDDCEARAFKFANAVARRVSMEGGHMDQFLFVELASLTQGKAFDALVAGSFVDMFGRKVTFKKSELETYVKNTRAGIEATKTESGEVVGLPIDARGHDNGDGAGWIVDVALVDGKVRLTPKWTEIGLNLIKKGIRRFFSPTVNPKEKVILGGSLTNWPATRDKKGTILLRPVELEMGDGWALDEEDDYFSEFQGDDENPGEQRGWVEAALMSLQETVEKLTKAFAGTSDPGEAEPNLSDEEVYEMDFTKEELEQMMADQLKAILPAALQSNLKALMKQRPGKAPKGEEDGEDENPGVLENFDFLKFLELEGVDDEFVGAYKDQLLGYYDGIKQKAMAETAQLISQVRREATVSEFVNRVTGGDEEREIGLGVPPDDLREFIMGLTPDQAAFIQPLLENVVDGKAVVKFRELGHSRTEGTKELDPEYARMLEGWIKDGNKIREFFEVNKAELGQMVEYNLKDFREAEQQSGK